MKALVLEEYKKLVYKDAPKPDYKSNEVLVRVKACGICGSDLHFSKRKDAPAGVVFGLEFSGIRTFHL